jgi:hypothetical protein
MHALTRDAQASGNFVIFQPSCTTASTAWYHCSMTESSTSTPDLPSSSGAETRRPARPPVSSISRSHRQGSAGVGVKDQPELRQGSGDAGVSSVTRNTTRSECTQLDRGRKDVRRSPSLAAAQRGSSRHCVSGATATRRPMARPVEGCSGGLPGSRARSRRGHASSPLAMVTGWCSRREPYGTHPPLLSPEPEFRRAVNAR